MKKRKSIILTCTLLVLGALLSVTIVSMLTAYNVLRAKDMAVGVAWIKLYGAFQEKATLVLIIADTVGDTLQSLPSSLAVDLDEMEHVAALRKRISATQEADYFIVDSEARRLQPYLTAMTQNGGVSQDFLINQFEQANSRVLALRNELQTAIDAYNEALARFPHSIVATLFGFHSILRSETPEVAKGVAGQ